MTTQRKIILAADLTASSAFAAKWACHVAKLIDAQVVLAHIIELSVPNWLRSAYDVLDDTTQRAKVEQKIRDWYKGHTDGEADEVLIAVGHPAEQLAQLAQDSDATMLVVARSSKGVFQKFLAGSTAQMLAANPPCIVAIVHPDHTTLNETTRLMVATDLTDTSERAITAAAVITDVLHGHLDVVHTAKAGGSAALEGLELPAELGADALVERANEQLQKILSQHHETLDQVKMEAHVLDAEPVDGLRDFVEANHIGLVFVGNAAKYNVLTNVFGRVSVKLTQVLDSTVVVVPPHVDAFEALVSESNSR